MLLIAAGSEIDAAEITGTTALAISILRADRRFFHLMIQRRALVNMRDRQGLSPLHWAAQGAHVDFCLELLRCHASINACDQEGRTPLFLAAEQGHRHVVEVLLVRGANRLLAARDGTSPLTRATSLGHSEIVALLDNRVAAGSGRHTLGSGNSPSMRT